MTSRVPVNKTYKLFINGNFPRSESGKSYSLNLDNNATANICQSSKKDARDAVVAARSAFPGWSSSTAMLRGQILYRIAEMLEGRKGQFIEEIIMQGVSPKAAEAEVMASIDCLIHYAGWSDKYQQIFSSVNPVASKHFNFSVPKPTGVVGIVVVQESALLGLVSMLAPIIVGGNTCVLIPSYAKPMSAITFAEVLNTSDVPPGVVNIITGDHEVLAPVLASHMDVNALIASISNNSLKKALQISSAENMKRVIFLDPIDWLDKDESQSPYFIMNAQEIQTTWHPIGN